MTEASGYEASERLPGLGHLLQWQRRRKKVPLSPDWLSLLWSFVTIITLVIKSIFPLADLHAVQEA